MRQEIFFISVLMLSVGCVDNETRFNQDFEEFESISRLINDKYRSDTFFGKTKNFSFCDCKENNCIFASDVCDNQISELMRRLDVKRISVLSPDCEPDVDSLNRIDFFFQPKSFLSPRRYVCYDPCDEAFLNESNSVEVKKLRRKWYYIVDTNFP